MASRPAKDTAESLKAAPLSVATWELQGPFPPLLGAGEMPASDELSQQLSAVLEQKRPNISLTAPLQCFAREFGRFVAAHGRRPQTDLLAFMAGRCGVASSAPLVGFMTQDAAGPAPVVNDETIGQLVDGLPISPNASQMGVWQGSGEAHHVLVTALATPRVDLTAIERTSSKTMRLAGHVHGATGWLQGMATVGALGASACTPSLGSTATLPAFDLSCVISPDDAYAVVDVVAGAPNAILGQRVLSLVLPVADAESKTFAATAVANDENRGDLVSQLNALRKEMSLPGLEEVPAQSELARALLPHYLDALSSENQSLADGVALGLLAGWDVDGPIRDAGFSSFMAQRGDHAPSLLAELTYFPSNRKTLLDPEATKLALATQQDGDSAAVGGIVATYTLFQDRRYPEYEEALLDELDRHRASRNKGPVQRVGGTDEELDPIMKKLAQGKITPADGMNRVLRTYSNKLNREFRGYTLGTMVIDGWMPAFPDDLLDVDQVAVTSRVGYFTAPNASWGQYVVYLIYTPL